MLNAAIIGCGDMGKIHADCVAKLNNIKNMAFCDLDLSKAKVFKEFYHADFATQDIESIINNTDIDIVYIATQTNSHLVLCLSTFQANKHLLIEKPLDVNIEDALKIHTEAIKSKKVVMVGLKFRFYSLIKKARQLITNPYMVLVQILDDPWPEKFWANDPVLGGGNVISQGVHGSDLLRFLAGSEPEQAYASGGNYHQKTGVIDNLAAIFLFENGITGNLVVGDTAQLPLLGKFCVQIWGAEGSLILTDRLTHLEFHYRNSTIMQKYDGVEDGFMEENRAFIKAINDKSPVEASTLDGYIAQAMIDAAIRSLKSKRVEKILK